MTRRTLASYGPRRASVRVFLEEVHDLVRVQWREHGAVRTKSWPNTTAGRTEAKGWARGFAETREFAGAPRRVRITNRDLWKAYCEAEFPHLRANTQRLYADAWNKWEVTWTKDFFAEDATPQMLDTFRAVMDKGRFSVNTIRMTIRAIKVVHTFGERRELLSRNRLASWRFKLLKERRTESPDEFRGPEFAKILRALDLAKGSQWRAHVALALCGYQGVRQHSALHLQWADVDFAVGKLMWRSEWDKTGREWSQPMREATRKALEAALARRKEDCPWVIPAPRNTLPYTAQALWWSLKAAEARAGVPHRPRRGPHGFRRMLAGDVAALTHDGLLGLRAIGDRDARQAERYIKDRPDEMAAIFAELDRNQTAMNAESTTGGKSEDAT